MIDPSSSLDLLLKVVEQDVRLLEQGRGGEVRPVPDETVTGRLPSYAGPSRRMQK
jgi:hypothetical protein